MYLFASLLTCPPLCRWTWCSERARAGTRSSRLRTDGCACRDEDGRAPVDRGEFTRRSRPLLGPQSNAKSLRVQQIDVSAGQAAHPLRDPCKRRRLRLAELRNRGVRPVFNSRGFVSLAELFPYFGCQPRRFCSSFSSRRIRRHVRARGVSVFRNSRSPAGLFQSIPG